MATLQGWRASDWSNSTEQEDEERNFSCRYRSTPGTQGGLLLLCSTAFSFYYFFHYSSLHSPLLIIQFGAVCLQVVGGKMTESGRLCAFITKVKKGSLADTVGHLRPGKHTAFPDRS